MQTPRWSQDSHSQKLLTKSANRKDLMKSKMSKIIRNYQAIYEQFFFCNLATFYQFYELYRQYSALSHLPWKSLISRVSVNLSRILLSLITEYSTRQTFRHADFSNKQTTAFFLPSVSSIFELFSYFSFSEYFPGFIYI